MTPRTIVSHELLTQSLPCTFTDGRPLTLKDIWEGVHECYKTRLLQGPWDTITQQVGEYCHFIVCILLYSFPLFIFSSSSLSPTLFPISLLYIFTYFTSKTVSLKTPSQTQSWFSHPIISSQSVL